MPDSIFQAPWATQHVEPPWDNAPTSASSRDFAPAPPKGPTTRSSPGPANAPAGFRVIDGPEWSRAMAALDAELSPTDLDLSGQVQRIAGRVLGDLSQYREGQVNALWEQAQIIWRKKRRTLDQPRDPRAGVPLPPKELWNVPRSETPQLPAGGPFAAFAGLGLLKGLGQADACGPQPEPFIKSQTREEGILGTRVDRNPAYDAWFACKEAAAAGPPREPFRVPLWMTLLSMVGTGVGAYHGYRRNDDSIGWAIGWALLGGLAPVIVVPIALAQGLGKRKKSR